MHHTQPVTYFTSTFVPADDDRVPDLETDPSASCFQLLTVAQKPPHFPFGEDRYPAGM
jgi:hypothetical protein